MGGGRIQKLLVKIGGDSKGLERASSRSVAALRRIRSAGASLVRTVGRLTAITGAIAFAGKKLFLDKFEEQEDAVAALRASLIATGKTGADALRQITDEAARLQTVTTAADEGLIAASATLATLAPSLNAAELSQAQTAIVAIADTFMKGDLASAALQVGKTLGSAVNSLSRYGFTITNTAAPASEKLAELMGSKTLGAAFEVSQAKAETLRGRLTQLGNAFGDLQEVGGRILSVAFNLTSSSAGLTQRIKELTASVEADGAKWVAWIRVLGTTIGAAGRILKGLVVIAFNVGQMIGRVFDIAASSIVLAFATAADKIAGLLNRIPGVELPTNNADAILGRIQLQARGLGADFATVKDEVAAVVGAVQDVATAAARASMVTGAIEVPPPPPIPAPPPEQDPGVASDRMKELQRIAAQAFSSTRTEAEKLQIELDDLQEAFLAGALDGETYARAVTKANEEFLKTIPTVRKLRDVGRDFATDFAVRIADAAAEGALSFKDFANEVISELKRIAIKLVIFKGLSAIFGGGGIVGAIGQSFGLVTGGKAHGGPIFPGRRYQVGELGREEIVSPTAGRVQRHDEVQRGGASVGPSVANLTIQLVTSDGRVLVDGITHQQRLDGVTKRSARVVVPAAVVPTGG